MRLIDADAMTGKFAERFDDACEQMRIRSNKDYWNGVSSGVNWGKNTIADAPTVDAVEVVHSSWGEGRFNTKGEYEERCLNCKMFSIAYGSEYCPNCGAKMDGGNEDGQVD